MTAINRLTTLERVRDWVGVTSNNDDLILDRLIDETSRFILSYIQRPTLFQYIFSDVYDGMGQKSQTLRHYPVQAVSLVMVDNVMVPAGGSVTTSGYILDSWDGLPPGRPQTVSLYGFEFRRGFSNVNIVYTTGYTITAEAQNVPASGNYTVAANAPHGIFGMDNGVTYSNGTPLVSVAANPAQGQYSVTKGGIYGFAAADSNAAVQISYSYVPADIEHACMVLTGERYRYKNRIGEISKTLGGQETVSFSQKDMPDFVKGILQNYKRVVMV